MSLKGGDKLEAALNKLASKLEKGGSVKVGFLEGSTYPDGTSIPLVAAINEYGAPSRGQPPRPYFRRMIAAKSSEWPKAIAGLLKSTNGDVQKTLELTGEGIKGQLIQSINDLVSPPLAQSTIDRKGFDKPLIDEAIMINSVGVEVK